MDDLLRYLVLGAGLGSMGEAIAWRLAKEDNSWVWLADQKAECALRSLEKLRKLPCGENSLIEVFNSGASDLDPDKNSLDVVKMRKGLRYFFNSFDIVISALPAVLNPIVAEGVLQTNELYRGERRTHYCDLGGFDKITKKLLSHKFAGRAGAAGISLVPECGLQPGLGNIHAINMYRKYFGARYGDNIESVIIYVGGLPARAPYYKQLFNLKGLEEIYYTRPLVISKGKILKKRQLLGNYEEFTSAKFGHYFGEKNGIAMEAATTGGLGALPYFMEGRVETLEERTLRFKGHYDMVRKWNRKNFIPEMKKHLAQNPELKDDFCLLQIEATGNDEAGKKIKAVRTMCVRSDENWSSMQKTTGFTAAIIAKMLAEKSAFVGAYPPEAALDTDEALRELNKDIPVLQDYQTLL